MQNLAILAILEIFVKSSEICVLLRLLPAIPCSCMLGFFFLRSEIPQEEDVLNELAAAPNDDATNAPAKKKPKLNYRAKFMGEWRKYCRIEGVAIANHGDLVSFWDEQTGVLAKAAQFLVNLPVMSAGVEYSFSLAGYADNKYRHNLPNETRRLTDMLLFNGDVEGRFATA